MRTFIKPLQIVLLVITVLITELGLFTVFLDTAMGQRNPSIGTLTLLLAFVFPAIIVPGVMRRTMKKVIAACFIIATLCIAYFFAVYKHWMMHQDLLVMLAGYIIVVIATAMLVRENGLSA